MLRLTNITKRFGPTVAVDDVSLSIAPGEIVGLVGENGAGKTTLMRIVAGELRADGGEVTKPQRIGMVHQHFAIVPEMTIAENLALIDRSPFRFLSRRSIESDAIATVQRSGIALGDVSRRAGELSIGEKSKLELIKAIAIDPALLILDEPTSVLTPIESAELFGVIRDRAERGTAIVFISHKVPEVLEIAERVVVMRRGKIVADSPRAQTTAKNIADTMVNGARAISPAGSRQRSGGLLLHLDDTLTLHRNEIVAILGVAGNGQTELVEKLRAMRLETRIGFIPEDRTRDAIVAEMSIAENVALGDRRWSKSTATARA
ncbi:MAG TPA: ATP-binding cassette domain-containing protein, partial [Thermoanaerobaculia bacterium]|nr:ATP-binding cassette domain-containing protein [Thermoanaerobaculia bacterium]